MTTQITLPNEQIFEFYEGSDPDSFTDLTGQNLNKAPDQLLANMQVLRAIMTKMLFGAPVYDPTVIYNMGDIVKAAVGSQLIYVSQIDNNLAQALNNPANWIPVTYNIDDANIGIYTTWSSNKIKSYADQASDDAGIVNAIVFGG